MIQDISAAACAVWMSTRSASNAAGSPTPITVLPSSSIADGKYGSWYATVAPAAISPDMISSAGDSRRSSTSGL